MIELLDIKPKYEKRMAQTIETKTDGTIIVHPRKMTNILTCEMEEIPKETLYLKINEIILALNRLEEKVNWMNIKGDFMRF